MCVIHCCTLYGFNELKFNRMEEITIYKFQLEAIKDALRVTANIHDSRNKRKQGVLDAINEALSIPIVVKSLPTKEEIDIEAWNRYGEVTGGSYHADRPYNRKCFRKGAEWMKQQLTK